jgi:hypothetical protein
VGTTRQKRICQNGGSPKEIDLDPAQKEVNMGGMGSDNISDTEAYHPIADEGEDPDVYELYGR